MHAINISLEAVSTEIPDSPVHEMHKGVIDLTAAVDLGLPRPGVGCLLSTRVLVVAHEVELQSTEQAGDKC